MSLNPACLSGVEKQGSETALNAVFCWSADVLVFLGILHIRTATADFRDVDNIFFSSLFFARVRWNLRRLKCDVLGRKILQKAVNPFNWFPKYLTSPVYCVR